MVAITIDIDQDRLTSYTDQFLATAWHVAQANPAPYDDRAAGELVEKLGWEIIRRWLGKVPAELYHHQPTSYYKGQLCQFARFTPGEGYHGGFNPEQRAAWDAGTWSVKPEAAAGLQPGIDTVVAAAAKWHQAQEPGRDNYMAKVRAEKELRAAIEQLRRPPDTAGAGPEAEAGRDEPDEDEAAAAADLAAARRAADVAAGDDREADLAAAADDRAAER